MSYPAARLHKVTILKRFAQDLQQVGLGLSRAEDITIWQTLL